jgi:parallel beta-helix repeat protein
MQRFSTRRGTLHGALMSLSFVLICASGCAPQFDAFVISKESQKLIVLDFDENKSLQAAEGSPFATGIDPVDIAFDPRHRRIYVTNSAANTLSVYKIRDGDRLEPLNEINTDEKPIAVTIDTRHDWVYVLHQDGKLLPIKGRDLTPQWAYQVFYATNPYPQAAGIAYDARNDLLYLLDQADNVLVILEGKSHNYVKVVPTGAKPSAVAFDHKNDRVYVTNKDDNTLSVFEAGPFCKMEETIDVGSLPSDVAYDPIKNLIFVSSRDAHQVGVFDAEGLEPTTQIDLPALAHAASLTTGLLNNARPSLLYVVNKGSGNVSVFEIRDRTNFVPLPDSPIGVLESPVGVSAVQPSCPEIISLSPQEARVGETLTILGLNFGDQQGLSRVEFDGFAAEPEDIISWATSKIEVSVPSLARSGAVCVIGGNCATVPPDGENVREFTVIPRAHIYVSSLDGDNQNGDGTQAKPYKTITHALSQAVASDVIHISAGSFDRELGERFPIRIKPNVHLEGRYSPTIMYDSSGIILEIAEGASMKGIQIQGEGPESGATGVLRLGNSLIEDCGIWKVAYGIRIDGEKRPLIKDSDISSSQYGIFVRGGANPIIDNNNVFNNYAGISVGLGSTAFIASNEIFENSSTGAILGPESSAFLLNNYIRRNLPQDQDSSAWGVWASSSSWVYLSEGTLD